MVDHIAIKKNYFQRLNGFSFHVLLWPPPLSHCLSSPRHRDLKNMKYWSSTLLKQRHPLYRNVKEHTYPKKVPNQQQASVKPWRSPSCLKELVSRPEEEIRSKSSSSYKRPLATDWKPLQFARVSCFIDNYKTHEVRWIKEFLESERKCISDFILRNGSIVPLIFFLILGIN